MVIVGYSDAVIAVHSPAPTGRVFISFVGAHLWGAIGKIVSPSVSNDNKLLLWDSNDSGGMCFCDFKNKHRHLVQHRSSQRKYI